jgi:hypothetical protein
MQFKALSAALAASFAIVAPAQAALIPAVFNFTTGNNNNVNNGNARVFSAVSPQLGTFNVRVTGWSLETTAQGTFVRHSKLMVYDGGLGVISGDDGNGDNNRHTIDNHTRKDFLILQFDRKVQFVTATFNTYAVNGGTKDSDAIIKSGLTNVAWNTGLGLNNQTLATLNALFGNTHQSLTNLTGNNNRNINPDGHMGNVWLIGSDWVNADGKIDGFKLNKLAVVPEPATWAMMISGFGLAGAAMRRGYRPARVLA